MVKRKHSIEQIIGKLRETEVELAQGRSVAEVCRSLGVTEQTYSRISILALARSQDTPPLRRIPRLFALNPAHHLRR